MRKNLISLFKEYGDKQEILSKLCESEELRKYNNSELHIIAAIGKLENPNVTAIAQYMGMTKGGISKNIKKLIDADLVSTYQSENNNKKIFYALTDEGRKIYDKHEVAHENWIERDNNFFSNFSDNEINAVADFLEKFINHLDGEIEKRS
ncbi:MAG: MarR family transcriptional regulator [Faecalibacterium sp.]|nr:MarR family transcriptional regulator [Ruminococcus sp.]MCM1391328.1 MarR family transcriptional regulator [Ruminococcus sp.]MCM1484887.1 MarR family transcriptional regulator [Faecalibacterium sp.]